MNRFENEFIFLDGEYQFVAKVKESLDFQKECFNISVYFSNCCKLCAFVDGCIKKCLVDENHVLVRIKYFELYKDWKKSINK